MYCVYIYIFFCSYQIIALTHLEGMDQQILVLPGQDLNRQTSSLNYKAMVLPWTLPVPVGVAIFLKFFKIMSSR